jgi:hypothetical protein
VRRGIASSVTVVLLFAACGTRTDLEIPESESESDAAEVHPSDGGKDAALDARADARDAAPDVVITDAGCSRDRDCDDGLECTGDRCDPRLHVCVYAPSDAFCDDGVYCDGVEHCAIGRGCVTTPRDCGDKVACTDDSCNEITRSCIHVPDDTKCPISYACDPTDGCQARAFAHDSTTLYDVRLPSGQVKVIGTTQPDLTDCALHPSNTLFGVAYGGIYTINQSTGAATPVRLTDLFVNGADAHPNGSLYVSGGNSLYLLDPQTGALSFVQGFPNGRASSGDLAFIGARLFASARGLSPNDDLVEFDLATKTSHVVGSIKTTCVWGLAAFGSTLYGLTCTGRILSIDTNTGQGTVLNQVSTSFWGASAR